MAERPCGNRGTGDLAATKARGEASVTVPEQATCSCQLPTLTARCQDLYGRADMRKARKSRGGAHPPATKSGAEVSGATHTSGASPGVSRKKGFVKVMYRMHPRHAAALRAEAFRRAQERSVGRPDASEVLREIVDAWMEKHAG